MKTPFLILLILFFTSSQAQTNIRFTVDMSERENHIYKIEFQADLEKKAFVDFAIPAWSPGYYQILNFGDKIEGFSAKNQSNIPLRWVSINTNTWRIYTDFSDQITISYQVISDINFVGRGYLDLNRAYIKPAAIFIYPVNQIQSSINIELIPVEGWTKVATGLTATKPNNYFATDYDILYDSPLLIGNLKELPEFYINEVPHRFIGHEMETFDEIALMTDLKKLISEVLKIFDYEIPYNHYTFLGLGKGNGGIEHLNSTAVSFTGNGLNGQDRNRILSFLTHEFFHNFNAKRIRPLKLGPFDYSQPNRTNSLWVAEGLTSYYETIILNRAGYLNRKEVLKSWSEKIKSFQKNEGRLKQTLAESSLKTWEDGPFGKKGETISYYEKGPFIGLFLDISIRNATQNKKSLDDVMRFLYNEYHKNQKRGFTDEEVMAACEKIANHSLRPIFNYIYTVDEMDYSSFLNLIGIAIDSEYHLTVKSEITEGQEKILNDLFRL